MADHDENTDNVSHGIVWDVTDLDEDDSMNEEKSSSINRAETYDVMYMSGHFLFPPSQHENLPLEPETDKVGGGGGDESSIHGYEDKSYMEDEENLKIEESSVSHFCPGIPIFDEQGNILAVSGTKLQGGLTLKEENLYNGVKYSSFPNELVADEDNTSITESTKFFDQGLDSAVSLKPMVVDKGESEIPCEAWWKKHATSIFVASTVMGLVILGQCWQQERWKVFQLRWQMNINEEKLSRLLSPLSQLKDVIVGGYHEVHLLGEAAQRNIKKVTLLGCISL